MNGTDVQQLLERMLGHPVFARAARMRDLLTYLMGEELAGRGKLLNGYRVGVEGLRKPQDFDPSTDASVRVEVGRLRRMLAQYFGESPAEATVVEIPKGSYRPRLVARTVPDPVQGHTHPLPSSGPAVAVLAFEFDHDCDEQLLLATGLREELLSELFRYRELHIVDASGLPLEPADTIAARCMSELECEFLLRCRLYDGDAAFDLRLSVLDLQHRSTVWTGRFEIARDKLDVIESATAVAAQVAGELARPAGAIGIAAINKRLQNTPDTWTATDCVLRWHLYRLRDRGPETHQALRTRVRDLLRADPGFALGYVMYALLKIDEVVYRLNPEGPAAESLKRAAFLIEQALGTDPNSAMAYYVKAQYHYFSREFDEFSAAIDQALSLHPRSAEILHQSGTFLCFCGEWARGGGLMEQAGMRYHPGVGYRLAHMIVEYFTNPDPEPGRRLLETCYLPPNLSVAHIVASLVQVKSGNLTEAGRLLRRAHEIERSLNRSLEDLVRLWFTDPPLIERTLGDLQRARAGSGIVLVLK